MSLSLKNLVHHGVEGVAFVAIGTWATSNFVGVCAAYGIGKITYLGTKTLLESCAPEWSKDTRRSISWVASVLVGGSTLHIAQKEITRQSISIFTTMATTLGVTAASLGIRALADKGFKRLTQH